MQSDIAAAVAAYQQTGNKAAAAKLLGIPISTFKDRLTASGREVEVKGRIDLDFHDGVIVVFGDAHWWPAELSTANRALLKLLPDLKPSLMIANGDMTDMATVSRHPPLGWTSLPTVADELSVCKERLGEISDLLPSGIRKIWPVGNHDSRLECRLAQVAPELKDVYGTSLKDHFPDWEPCYSIHINKDLVVKHRWKGGQNAPANNSLWSGRSIITSHLHAQSLYWVTDLNGDRWGADTGCLADPFGEQFSYQEDNPRSHRSGFLTVRYHEGRLLTPEFIRVVEPGLVEYRSELIAV
jgi:hypothetical protein